ncbi:MAG: cation:proton antiporter [Gemmatimonadaceae bacterium]|nr:cation:proton antiporter [Gemmatimonadaceae bacterium]
MASIILVLGLLYFLAHFLSNTFDRSRVPDVLVLMIIGIVVGPLLEWTTPESFGQVGSVLTTVALAVILFESGTTLNIGSIVRSARSTLQVTLATSFLTIGVVGVLAGVLLEMPWISAFILGTIASGTSAAVVIPMVKVLKVKERAGTVMILESAVTDVTSIVFTFALLNAALQGEVNVGLMLGQTLSALVFAAVIGVAGGIGWLLIWEKVRQFPTTIFTTLASAFVLYGFAELLGFAGAIAVLAYGITLSNHEYFGLSKLFKGRGFSGVTPVESDFYKEIVFLLKTFFFVYLGISMRFSDAKIFGLALALMLILTGARLFMLPLLVPRTISRSDAAVVSVMIPKGLAAAVLAGLPLERGIAGAEEIQAGVYAIVLVSITLTAMLVSIRDGRVFGPVFGRALRAFPEVAPEEPGRGTPRSGIATVPAPAAPPSPPAAPQG